jgi:hypothetical protein
MDRVEMVYPQDSYTYTREEAKAIWRAVSFFLEFGGEQDDPEGPKEVEILHKIETHLSLSLKE